MNKIDYQALREIAKKATQGEWSAFISPGTGTYAVHTPGDKRCEDVIKWTGFDGQKNAENNARYIAAFNPEVVQTLLDELETAKKRIAELEAEPVRQTYKLNELAGNSPVIPDGWISCSERMPDSNCLYLCWGTYFEGDEPGYIPAYFFVYQTNGWTEWQPVEDDCNPREVIITHWMPLPAAPKQEVK
ncbi:TPA: ead/Ea22-like family protein [Escherichia coli]